MTAGDLMDEKNGQPPQPQPKRIHHVVEAGGCGKEITASCSYFQLSIPMVGPNGPGMMQTIVAIVPMICPECGKYMVMEIPASPVQVARGLPKLNT
jgi:hypothetical protein